MEKNSFSYEQLIDCANGDLFGKGNAQLPSPPMLMFDRITNINETGGVFQKGEIVAELDIKPDLLFLSINSSFILNSFIKDFLESKKYFSDS